MGQNMNILAVERTFGTSAKGLSGTPSLTAPSFLRVDLEIFLGEKPSLFLRPHAVFDDDELFWPTV